MGICGSKPGVSRAKRLVDAVFAAVAGGENGQKEMAAVTQYAVEDASKLPRIAKRVARQTRRDLSRGRFAALEAATRLLGELCDRCHSDVELLLPVTVVRRAFGLSLVIASPLTLHRPF